MKVKINGEVINFDRKINLCDLVKIRNLEGKMFVIEKNLQIVPKENYSKDFLEDGDTIEIASLCGGG